MRTAAETGRRIKAARVLADIPTVHELARHINRPRFGHRVLNRIEQGERNATLDELTDIANACGLHPGFFTTPTHQLGEQPGPLTPALEQRIAQLEAAIHALRQDLKTESQDT